MKLGAGLAAIAAALLAGCGQTEGNQQSATGNEAVQPVNAGSVDAGAGAPEAAPQPSDLSSGMPVPGANTPEHIVVNDAGNNAS